MVLLGVGVLLMVAGFCYDVVFAGIPYQDPTPEMSARYAMHSRIASVVVAAGGVAFLVGVLGALGRFLCGRRSASAPASEDGAGRKGA